MEDTIAPLWALFLLFSFVTCNTFIEDAQRLDRLEAECLPVEAAPQESAQ